ncbi:hypothetical protein VTO73DRAFT_2891 [Trametes versicolor]
MFSLPQMPSGVARIVVNEGVLIQRCSAVCAALSFSPNHHHIGQNLQKIPYTKKSKKQLLCRLLFAEKSTKQ